MNLVVALEQRIEDEFGVSLTLADEKAMSYSRSPFRNVQTLRDYVLRPDEPCDPCLTFRCCLLPAQAKASAAAWPSTMPPTTTRWSVAAAARVSDVHENYQHFQLDVADEPAVKRMFTEIRTRYGRLDALVNNAGIASMNHLLTTPLATVLDVLHTNVAGPFLFCREAAKLMQRKRWGRIVNFATVATPLRLEGEAIYAASKAAVISLTQILARSLPISASRSTPWARRRYAPI